MNSPPAINRVAGLACLIGFPMYPESVLVQHRKFQLWLRNLTALILFSVLGVASVESAELTSQGPSELVSVENVPRTIFETRTSYVFESALENFGNQDAFEFHAEAGRRFLLSGDIYLRLGVAYHRYEFGGTGAPVPDHLQSFAAVIGFEYMRGQHVGACFYAKPGFYTEDAIGLDSFDVPMTFGSAIVVQKDRLYFFGGATTSFLRGKFPVLPLFGVIWRPSDKLRVMGLVPDPRIVYSPTKALDIWVGGELGGGSFRTDSDKDIRPSKLSGAQVDYSDYRAGIGVTYSPSNAFSLALGAGYSLQRSFDFERAGEKYSADPAPYFRLAVKTKF